MSSSVSNEVVLQVSNLTKIYGKEYNIGGRTFGRSVVGAKNVSFSIKKGEIFGFLGPNGAGKTTVMRTILDYLHLQNGSVTFFGSLDHHKDALLIKENIGYVPGDVALYDKFSGNEIIKYFNNFRPINHEFVKKLRSIFRADLTLKIGQLSSGNRKQVALIAALASKPDLLILDEPSGGLDPLMAANFHDILKEIAEEGITIFISSHDLSEVQTVCNRVAIIKEGEIILVETIEDLKAKFLQKMRIIFSKEEEMPTAEELLDLSTVVSAEKVQGKVRTFLLTIEEDANELLKFVTKFHIKRLAIEDATIEEIFLQYYQ
ncbi:MAG: ATP-binding cassette domain-containing protein [Candidatus Hodarchaeales archaeon]|jgi:ABC-2 type transport system ATP-binding protein